MIDISGGLTDFFFKGSPKESAKAITNDDLKKAYFRRKPVGSYMPWLDIIDENKILLEDAKSVAAVFEIQPIPTEARSADYLLGQRDSIRDFITGTFEEHNSSPWVVSVYAWRSKSMFKDLTENVMRHAIRQHAQRDAKITEYSKHFINKILGDHINDLTQEGGLFTDPLNDQEWGGNVRKVYMVFYRRSASSAKRRKDMSPERELDQQAKRVSKMLGSAGIRCHRLNGQEIRDWLFLWMNPKPKLASSPEEWLKNNPYTPGPEKTADYTLTNDVVSRDVRCDEKTKAWYFDGVPHTLLSVERMTKPPAVGQTSAELYDSEEDKTNSNARTSCMLDELPDGSVLIINFICKQQQGIRRHLERLAKNAKGDSAEAQAVRDEVNYARLQIAKGNKMYPYSMGVAIRAADDDALDDAILDADAILAKNYFQIIDPDHDDVRMDRYLRFMPCAYDPDLDQVECRERIIYTNHLANAMPLYGRGVGTGNPAILAYNRGGEPFTFDPFLMGDRAKNAHLFLFGPTGAGKSSKLVYLQMLIMAIYTPRWVTIEAGNSFGLLSEYFKKWGFSVVDIVLRPNEDKSKVPSIPPFKPALSLVDDQGNFVQESSDIEPVLEGDAELEEAASDDDSGDEEVNRDILGEMLIIARLMVTGGEEKEEARMSRADVGLLKHAILNSAVTAKKAEKNDILVDDVLKALLDLKAIKPERAQRIDEMAEAMSLFCDGFAGDLFNRPGDELPDADYIRIEMGSLASGNDNNDKLSVAYISIVNQIIARAQRTQRDGRPTINLTDEAHVITTNKLLSAYLVVVSKLLGRRMGLWLWQATQNMKDYSDDAEKMLAMFEWWVCLCIDHGELKHIERFKDITDDQRSMLLCTQKEVPLYTEGVVMSDNVQGLFRNIAPGLCFALAGTEKEEKRARYKIMKQHNVDECKAAEMIGEGIAKKRREYSKRKR